MFRVINGFLDSRSVQNLDSRIPKNPAPVICFFLIRGYPRRALPALLADSKLSDRYIRRFLADV